MSSESETLRHVSERPEKEPLAALVAAARAGDEQAWRSLVTRFTPLLRAVAHRHRLSDADAADAVQTTWVKCVENLGRLREPAALAGWLVTTCRNEALHLIRSRNRCVPLGDEALTVLVSRPRGHLGDALDPVDAVLDEELVRLLTRAVADLPERQRLLVGALLDVDGKGKQAYEELAVSLSMPLGSIGPTRQRAVRRLRQDLQQQVA